MTNIVGLFVCPMLCLYSSGDAWLCCMVWLNTLGEALLWPCISIYLCVGTAWATFKYEPYGNFQAIGKVEGTSI